MAKIYGARMKMMYENTTSCRIRNQWYSADESEALEKMRKAQAIAPPTEYLVEFTPISDDVTILETGIYLTERNHKVEINILGPFQVHGCFLRKDGKKRVGETCTFYANGDPITHQQYGKIVSKAK